MRSKTSKGGQIVSSQSLRQRVMPSASTTERDRNFSSRRHPVSFIIILLDMDRACVVLCGDGNGMPRPRTGHQDRIGGGRGVKVEQSCIRPLPGCRRVARVCNIASRERTHRGFLILFNDLRARFHGSLCSHTWVEHDLD